MRSWNDFVNDLAWTRGSLDDSSYRAFLRAASLGISPDDAIRACAHRIQAAGDTPRIAKLRSQCERAYQFARADAVTTSSGAGVTLPRPIKRRLNVDFALVRELAKK